LIVQDGQTIDITDDFQPDIAAAAQTEPSEAPKIASFQTLTNAKAGMTSVVNVVLPSQRIKLQKSKDLVFTSAVEDKKEASTEMIETDSKPIKPTEIEEILVGKGIGNALKVLRERGMLGIKNIISVGRTLDQTLEK
jgi:hypothetical protein